MTIKEKYEAYEKKKRIFLKADIETAERLNIKVGDEYSIFPEPKNIKESFERLENFNGLIILESYIEYFKKTFPINERTLTDKLKLIDEFISEAEQINIEEAISKVSSNHPKAKQYEYVKLRYDYYKNENLNFYGFNDFFGPLVVLVYAEYFLFKDWLKSELINLNKTDSKDVDKIKIIYIDKIKEAEELAKSTLEIFLKQDFFEIENAKFNEETQKELLKNYYSNTISKYVNTRNLYKASNEQFHFLNKESEYKLTEDDRVDFIAMILTNYLTESNEVDNQFKDDDLVNIFNQLKNIDEIIYETKLSELKYNAIKKLTEKIQSDKNISKGKYPVVKDALKISEEFIEQMKLYNAVCNYLFRCEEDKKNIIPENQTHDFLKSTFPIDEAILDFYFESTKVLISNKDKENLIKNNYRGNIDRTFKPYSIKIFGAYHSRKKIYNQLSSIFYSKGYYINNKKIKFFSDLVPYFIDYSEGFKIGYDDFEKNCINPFLNEFSDKSDFTYKVFEYVTKHISFNHSWINNGSSCFSFTAKIDDLSKKEIKGAFEDGQKQGHFYKAWSIILGNSKVYAPFFEEYYSNNKVKNKEIFTLEENHNEITNDYEKSSIEDYLEQFKDLITNNTYNIFIDAYLQYFTNGKFPSIDKKILFKKMNKKKLGWELKELYKSLKTDNLDIEYFRFAQQNINLFKDEIIEEVNFNKSKFYKTFTTKV